MKLSKETLDKLDIASRVCGKIKLKAHDYHIRSLSETSDMFSTTIVEDIPYDVMIFNLKGFLNIVTSLFTEPDFEFSENYVVISDSNNKMRYMYSSYLDQSYLSNFDAIDVPTLLGKMTINNEIDFPASTLSKVLEIAKTTTWTEIDIVTDEAIKLIFHKDDGLDDSFTHRLVETNEGGKDQTYRLDENSFSQLAKVDYKMYLLTSTKGVNFVCLASGDLNYLLSVKKDRN